MVSQPQIVWKNLPLKHTYIAFQYQVPIPIRTPSRPLPKYGPPCVKKFRNLGRNGSENSAMISKVRNGSQVQNGLDLRNNSKHFVILSTFGIFSKSARNAGNDCGNTHHLHFQHFPRACNKLLPNLLLFFFWKKFIILYWNFYWNTDETIFIYFNVLIFYKSQLWLGYS